MEQSDPSPTLKQSRRLHRLGCRVVERLEHPAANETIHLCGPAALMIIGSQPKEALDLAERELKACYGAQIPTCWRRLYEEASLHMIANLLLRPTSPDDAQASPQRGISRGDLISEIVWLIDEAVMVTGAPGRNGLFEEILGKLHGFIDTPAVSRRWSKECPPSLQTNVPIHREVHLITLSAFQAWLHCGGTPEPLIIQGALDTWPATGNWQDLEYLMLKTLGGRRMVPVEIGKSYTDENWTQQMMSVAEFADRYLLTDQPKEMGYIAQHDLLSQIPELRADVMVPDYCWVTPPLPAGAAQDTVGLSNTPQLDSPSIHSWLGPKGTKTPLHTDPYHNILCQVVGYKYVRLYAPEERPNLYPWGTNEQGINLANTSQVDIQPLRPHDGQGPDPVAIAEVYHRYPCFKDAKFKEAIIGPGDSLYIPLGYWHYVESLTPSFSVSFWWN